MADTAGTPARRTVVAAAGAAGLAAALAACSSGSENGSQSTAVQNPPPQNTTTGGEGGGGAGTNGNALGSASEVPVGGGKIFESQKIVVTQPKAGEFKAFSTICTHQGCPVTTVEGGTINCPCHGSKFSIEDGSPAGGPATKPLEAKNVTVEGDSLKVT